jgi:methionyl-tRNA formyltransferase
MTEQPQGSRIVVIANVLPIAEAVIGQLGEMGHDVVAWLMTRRPESRDLPPPPWGETSDKTAPQGVNLIWARGKEDLAPHLRGLEPDVVLCWGFSWKIPQEALDVPRYGAVNQHPALLPRHRGPIPLSWALREGDPVFGVTWHRMDADFDTGAILAQSSIPILDEETTMFETGPRIVPAGLALLPQVFERLAAGDPGDPQRARPGAACSKRTTRRSTGRRRRRGRSTTRCGRGRTRSEWGPCRGRSPSSTASA